MADRAFDFGPNWTDLLQTPFTGAEFRLLGGVTMIPHLCATLSRAVLHQQREVIAFAEKRCDAVLALVDKLDQAGSQTEISAAWLDFFTNSAGQYLGATGKLIELEMHDAAEVTSASTGDDLRDIARSAQLVA